MHVRLGEASVLHRGAGRDGSQSELVTVTAHTDSSQVSLDHGYNSIAGATKLYYTLRDDPT